MKALIFYLEGQDELFQKIRSLLEKEIFKGIRADPVEIDRKYGHSSSREMHERCRRYLRLLRSSLLATGAFEIVAHNDSQTHWSYFGSSAEFGTYCFELTHKRMTSLFPAVAIADRIVMLPEAFTHGMSVHPRSFLWLPQPLEARGVELVDYSIQSALEHAVSRVGTHLKREWKNLCHRHMGIRGLFQPDFHELSELLKVDLQFLTQNNLYSPDVNFTASVTGRATPGVWSKVTLEIHNELGRPFNGIRVRVRAPFDTLKSPISEIRNLKPPEPLSIDFEVKARTAPFCPLEVFLDLGDTPEDVPSFPIPVQIEVASGH